MRKGKVVEFRQSLVSLTVHSLLRFRGLFLGILQVLEELTEAIVSFGRLHLSKSCLYDESAQILLGFGLLIEQQDVSKGHLNIPSLFRILVITKSFMLFRSYSLLKFDSDLNLSSHSRLPNIFSSFKSPKFYAY